MIGYSDLVRAQGDAITTACKYFGVGCKGSRHSPNTCDGQVDTRTKRRALFGKYEGQGTFDEK